MRVRIIAVVTACVLMAASLAFTGCSSTTSDAPAGQQVVGTYHVEALSGAVDAGDPDGMAALQEMLSGNTDENRLVVSEDGTGELVLFGDATAFTWEEADGGIVIANEGGQTNTTLSYEGGTFTLSWNDFTITFAK